MIDSSITLNKIFAALADVTRREILERVSRTECTISELAEPYAMSLAAIAKHISVLEKAGCKDGGSWHMAELAKQFVRFRGNSVPQDSPDTARKPWYHTSDSTHPTHGRALPRADQHWRSPSSCPRSRGLPPHLDG
ncbi:ArsR/SmtB family transcription factor [Leptolyngbya sp. PCC 6406]|uniref:ArsR/SmtB family transcription factor n=1 Tax=Leptolyngbya sp. PCC 6406 TaxID=1173264 RepID=UPI00090730C2|nr:metalloregulator ArsR/SmtB family transcription factor [Leptolyngbya sp. PCC 6406]